MEEDKNVTNVMMMKGEEEKEYKESRSTFKNTNTNIRNKNINPNNNNDNDKKNNIILKCSSIGNNNNNNNDSIIPLSNNEYQEYAFLQVQSVHNYSKASRLVGNAAGGNEKESSMMKTVSSCHQYENNEDDDNDNEDYDDDDECNFNENKNQKILKKKIKRYVTNNDYDDDDDEYDTMSRKNTFIVPECGESNNDEEKLTPDHHTRRPMNAFLIFCKRHRAIVRDKYKNLENRSITKILGDWWATLSAEEKTCYTSLAKQYKDAFFSANPNFKWYKLPAPPLRTLNTRPGNIGRSTITTKTATTTTGLFIHSETDYEKNDISNENAEINSTPTDRSSTTTITHDKSYEEENYNKEGSLFEDEQQQQHHQENYSNVGIFKLADETQMGELNSLIKNERQQQNQQQNNFEIDNSSFKHFLMVNNSSKTKEKEEENLEKNEYMMMNDSSKNMSPNVRESLSTNDSSFKKIIKVCITTTNKEGENNNYPGKRKAFINDYVAADDDETQNSSKRKSIRTCKGKKYQEFRCSGQIMPSFVKNQQMNLKPKLSLSSSWSFKYDDDIDEQRTATNNNYCNRNYYYSSSSNLKTADRCIENNQFNPNNNIKQSTFKQEQPQQQFYNFDFDLEEKIKSLPIQNLDNYLQRKRDTKKKKKFNSKKQNFKYVENTKTATAAEATKTTASNNNNSISVSNNNNTVIDYNNISNNNKVSSINDQEENRNNQFQQILKTATVVVGSQKRKARKESITRRDINPAVMNVISSQTQQHHHQQQSLTPSPLLKLNMMQNIFDTNTEILLKSELKSISQIQKQQQKSESNDNIIKINHNDTITNTMSMDSYTNLNSLNILAEVAVNHIDDEKT